MTTGKCATVSSGITSEGNAMASSEISGSVQRMLLTNRGNNMVKPPSWEVLPATFLYDANGLPRPEVIKEHFKREGLLSESDVLKIITRCALICKDEPNVLRLEDPVVISGDIHGQFYDLLSLFEAGGDPSVQKYIFLGDYVDRGCFGIEVILLLMCYKIRYPHTMVLLRGNHESRHLTAYFNFKQEVLYKYSLEVYNAAMSAFDCLPLACVLNGCFLCVHGGLSPELKRVEDIAAVHRFREPPSTGLMCDLLWADPMDEKESDPTCLQPFIPNTARGCSYIFSHAAACQFLDANNLVAIIRGHEAQDEGFHLYKAGSHGFPAVICVFSAPNYCDTYGNRASITVLDGSVITIRQFNSSPHPYYLPNFMNAFAWSLPFVIEKLMDAWGDILHVLEVEENTMISPNSISGSGMAFVMPEDHSKNVQEKVLEMGEMCRMSCLLREKKKNLVNPANSSLLSVSQGGSLNALHLGLPEVMHSSQECIEFEMGKERWPQTPLKDEDTTAPNAVTKALSEAANPSKTTHEQ